MSAPISTLIEKLHQYIDRAEDKKVKAFYTIIETDIEESQDGEELSKEHEKELDRRLANHKTGKLKYYTLDEVRKGVLQAIKK
jgi:putative addiction module component (TIGR02574 family)